MKKTLLFVVAIAAGFSSQAQVTVDTLVNFPPNIISGISHSTFANHASGSWYCQIDSPRALPVQDQIFGLTTHGTMGFLSGTTAPSKVLAAAECFNPHLTPIESMQITGALSIWAGGSNAATSSMTVDIKVWDKIDTNMRVALGTGPTLKDSVTGFPMDPAIATQTEHVNTMNLNSVDQPIPQMPSGTPKYQVTTFSSPIPVTGPFFLGFEFGSYDYTAGDTLALCDVLHNTSATGSILDYYLYTNSAYTMYLSRNCVKTSTTGTWTDYNSAIGGTQMTSLCIVPIVKYDNAVGNVTKNNLTTYNAFPNPATNTINVKYALQHATNVTIAIMDMSGRTLSTTTQSKVSQGEHVVPMSISNLASGNYIFMVRTDDGDALATKFTVSK